MNSIGKMRSSLRELELAPEADVLAGLIAGTSLGSETRSIICVRATQIIERIRTDDEPGLMEVFLAEYGLSSNEGVALMCLAEALLRVPDADTIDDLIEDKIAPSRWGEHLGKSSSSLVNASTWALMLTGKVLDTDQSEGVAGVLHTLVKRMGEPVIRTAVKRAIHEMGNQFVLGESIQAATDRANEDKGFNYSYDMLGEAALTASDAGDFLMAYEHAIKHLATIADNKDIRENPGISIKLSALHPRYEQTKRARILDELAPILLSLCLQAKQAGIGLNIDAEESERLELSLDVIEAVLSDERLAGWHGFGVVVQAYGKRAASVIDWLYALAEALDRRIMVRLVKGAYWDSEIKRAQVLGLAGYPVYTNKVATDIAYICCAQKLLRMRDRIYPQFATHNAHSVAAILAMVNDKDSFEFQRLHGMGDALHRQVASEEGTRCRVYAPVGTHRDLLAYLVRRLLENGANSSFVNQVVDLQVPAEEVAADPFVQHELASATSAGGIALPVDLYAPARDNAQGWDVLSRSDIAAYEQAREPFKHSQWHAEPLLCAAHTAKRPVAITNPADAQDQVGDICFASASDIEVALHSARNWHGTNASMRAGILHHASVLYERNHGQLFSALAREAGKTPLDAIAELREAVDFLRYYATQAETIGDRYARGVVLCISPWNFPLAIFTGQIAAALAAGNAVVAKPAEHTSIVATLAVRLLHEAGVPKHALQLITGIGAEIGDSLVSDHRIDGVCFTGSTATAQRIHKQMANNLKPDAVLIAETGGINAMIIDSTALPEQAIQDVIDSAFQSAGQRCSALRLLYVQQEVADVMLDMLLGAMDELTVGNAWYFDTDIGPVINSDAQNAIQAYIQMAKQEGRLLKQLDVPVDGTFVAPAVIRVSGMQDLQKEIFGPVLHVATFESHQLADVVKQINASGFGLTFGLHTRIDDRVESISSQVNAGNIYINRNQIGAVVESQPFGGEGLSGTGPKAGGPMYIKRLTRLAQSDVADQTPVNATLTRKDVQQALDALPEASKEALLSKELPGPTGESNHWSTYARGAVLCLGPSLVAAEQQAAIAREQGCSALLVCENSNAEHSLAGTMDVADLTHLRHFDAVALWGDELQQRAARIALANRPGAILPLFTDADMAQWCVIERHVCIDTTASGGNASLLAEQ